MVCRPLACATSGGTCRPQVVIPGGCGCEDAIRLFANGIEDYLQDMPAPRSDRPEVVFVAALIRLSDACLKNKVDTIFNQVVLQGQVLTPRPSYVGLRPPGNGPNRCRISSKYHCKRHLRPALGLITVLSPAPLDITNNTLYRILASSHPYMPRRCRYSLSLLHNLRDSWIGEWRIAQMYRYG